MIVQDRHVIERHKQVYPEKAELDLVLSLSDKTERALKRVSDKLRTKVRIHFTSDNFQDAVSLSVPLSLGGY